MSQNIQTSKREPPTGLDKELNDLVRTRLVNRGSSNNPPFLSMVAGPAAMGPVFNVWGGGAVAPPPQRQDPQQQQQPDAAFAKVLRDVESLVKRGASIERSGALFVVAAGLGLEDDAKTELVFRTLLRLGGNVNGVDGEGNTPLHVAAGSGNAGAARFLVDSGGAAANGLLSIRNREGETPLQTYRRVQEGGRTDFAASLGFSGLAPREVDVIPRFECLSALLPPAEKSRLREGWLSPRLLEALDTTAQFVVEEFQDDWLPPFPRSEYISTQIVKGLPKKNEEDFGAGYCRVWECIQTILQRKQAPTVERIKGLTDSRSNPSYGTFLRQGGKVEFAVDALLMITKNAVVDGDDWWEYGVFKDDIEAHPPTAFDKDFGLAWFMCIPRGGGELRSRGPYNSYEDYDDEGEEDDDDDEEGDY